MAVDECLLHKLVAAERLRDATRYVLKLDPRQPEDFAKMMFQFVTVSLRYQNTFVVS